VVHLAAELIENAATFSSAQVRVTGRTLTSGGVLVEITDEGLGIADQELEYTNWRLDNPPVIDVGVSRRMGLFVVGRLAARHGIRVRLRHVQPHGLSALVWLPGTVAEQETASPIRTRRWFSDEYSAAARVPSAPVSSAPVAAPPSLSTADVPAPAVMARSGGPDWFGRDKPSGSAEAQSPMTSWTSPADDGFRVARAVASPSVGETSAAGLPTRVPNANLVPGSIRRPADRQAEDRAGWTENRQQAVRARRRSPEEVRNRLAEFQRGAHQGRSDAPWNFGADEK
jgi:hypothetical protein